MTGAGAGACSRRRDLQRVIASHAGDVSTANLVGVQKGWVTRNTQRSQHPLATPIDSISVTAMTSDCVTLTPGIAAVLIVSATYLRDTMSQGAPDQKYCALICEA